MSEVPKRQVWVVSRGGAVLAQGVGKFFAVGDELLEEGKQVGSAAGRGWVGSGGRVGHDGKRT